MTGIVGEWDDWIAREERRSDTLDPALAARWLATFDRAAPADGAMPQGIHWCLCTPDTPTAMLGADGHPKRDSSRDSLLPPVPLPRRMWASSEVSFHAPLVPGDSIERVSSVENISEKDGRSGKLVFVTVAHESSASGLRAVSEKQHLVYRAAAAPDAPLVPGDSDAAPFDGGGWDAVREIAPGPPLLQRYSALSFNSHRIHYDAPYARGVERYRGLVVHGPLTATLLLDLAAQQLGDNALTTFAFRGISPAIAGDPLRLALRREGDALELGAFAGDGREVMRATASL